MVVDGAGLAPGAISICFVNWTPDRGQGLTRRHWLKRVAVVDLQRRLILAWVVAKPSPTCDRATLHPPLCSAPPPGPIRALAGAEFDVERDYTFIP